MSKLKESFDQHDFDAVFEQAKENWPNAGAARKWQCVAKSADRYREELRKKKEEDDEEKAAKHKELVAVLTKAVLDASLQTNVEVKESSEEVKTSDSILAENDADSE